MRRPSDAAALRAPLGRTSWVEHPPRQTRVRLLYAALAAALAVHGRAQAQVIAGRVEDQTTGRRISGAFITVADANGRLAAPGHFSNATGEFAIPVQAPGLYFVRADMLGYTALVLDSVLVARTELVVVEFRLQPAPVPLDALEARAELSLREEYTMAGVRRRRAQTYRVGPARVFMQGDYDMRYGGTVGDILSRMPTRNSCYALFFNGFRMRWDVLSVDVNVLEAVEIYQRWEEVPLPFRTEMIGCGAVAIWSREPTQTRTRRPLWQRGLTLLGAVTVMFLTVR